MDKRDKTLEKETQKVYLQFTIVMVIIWILSTTWSVAEFGLWVGIGFSILFGAFMFCLRLQFLKKHD